MRLLRWGLVAVLAYSCTVCWGRDYRVPAGSSVSSIQEILNRCRTGDRIILESSIYRGQITIDKSITLTGRNPESTILDGHGTGPVVQVTCHGIVRISNCTIRNGKIVGAPDQSVRGGGINNLKATLFLSDLMVQSNSIWGGAPGSIAAGDAFGGGVFSGGRLDIRDCTFDGNEAHGGSAFYAGRALGGGVYASSRLSVTRCSFTSNLCAANGYPFSDYAVGAGRCSEGNSSADVSSSCFAGNSIRAYVGKGAGYAQLGGRLRLYGCTFEANSAYRGGAFWNTGISSFDACLFVGNQANEGGSVLNEGRLSISKSVFDANTALNGGCMFNVGTVDLTDSCLTNNYGPFASLIYEPSSQGGGIFNVGTTRVDRCLLVCNAAEVGGALYNESVLRIINSTLEENRADAGGGVFNSRGGVIGLDRARFYKNMSLGRMKGSLTHGYPSAIHGQGGALFNDSTASVRGCVFEGNLATGIGCWGGIGGGFGGAVLNEGSLTVDRSAFHSNSVEGYSGYSVTDARGGAIFNGGFIALSNSTLSANRVRNDVFESSYNGALDGGALFSSGTATISHCTFVSNSLVPIGAVPEHLYGVSIYALGPVYIGNSIVADSTTEVARSCWGTFSSMGWNIFEATGEVSFLTTQPTDRLNVQARLGPIVTMYQGQHACLPLAGSPAIDGGVMAAALYDQRGLRRPRDIAAYPNTGDGSDIGAIEICNYDVALNLQRLESEMDGFQWRITLNNVGLRQVRQVIVVVLLPESSSLVSCAPARVIRSWKRLVFLDVGALSAAQEMDIDLVLERMAIPTDLSSDISASVSCSPGDEFPANNTMTVPAW